MVAQALWTAYATLGLESARALLLDSVAFVLCDLKRTPGRDDSFCWSYSPLDSQTVLNATLKGSRLLAQACSLGGGSELLEPASRSVRFALSHQSAAGRWPYSAADSRKWADQFHTGYVLSV